VWAEQQFAVLVEDHHQICPQRQLVCFVSRVLDRLLDDRNDELTAYTPSIRMLS
jgi:hypothetical protein